MEPKFQTSFIPKSPIANASSSGFSVGTSFSIIGTISTFFFVVTLLLSGSLYGYTVYMDSQIKESQAKLITAKSAFESPDNQKIILASDQLKSIRALLTAHTVISPLFELLEKETLPSVRLTSFTFARDSAGIVTVSIEGNAQSYAALAQQSKIFSDLPYLKKIEFNDISLSELGLVQMKIKLQIDSDILLYSKKLQAVSAIPYSLLQL